MPEIVTIDALGRRGDGIAHGANGPLCVPFTLPGERVLIERDGTRARAMEILEPSPERVPAVCRHFGKCGGCSLQMLPLDATRKLKRDFVVTALAQQGLEANVGETIGVSRSSRRRAALTALRVGSMVLLGYHERLSHRIVDLEECPVLAPAIADKLPRLRELLAPLLAARKTTRVHVLSSANGLDVSLEGGSEPDPKAAASLADIAKAAGVARLSIDGEPLFTFVEPALDVSGVKLVPPPGGFVQASADAEAAMAGLVTEHLAGAKRVADLFCGVGAFALALARYTPVRAIDSNNAALQALALAVRRTKTIKPVTTERRDLFAFPLSPQELEYDGIVFDPPYAGAKAQAAVLANSSVLRIAAISCNPATFARDARTLVDGGYRLERVVPVDQFVYSAETEVVGLFSKG